jgi:CheY-like chemotaxis protein
MIMEKKRILLVDDEKSFTSLLKLNLEETGRYEVPRGKLAGGRRASGQGSSSPT